MTTTNHIGNPDLTEFKDYFNNTIEVGMVLQPVVRKFNAETGFHDLMQVGEPFELKRSNVLPSVGIIVPQRKLGYKKVIEATHLYTGGDLLILGYASNLKDTLNFKTLKPLTKENFNFELTREED